MRVVKREGHTFVIGSTVCPHPSLCDVSPGEDYRAYILRHLADHEIQVVDPDTKVVLLPDPEDLDRNLGLNCLYFYAKHIQGNASLGTGEAIVADWEPCWEDAEFLANDTFHPDDLEQNTPWEKRVFRLRPFAERRKDGVTKRMKKLTKVRETQKTSWAKALIIWLHLRAYFLFGNCSLRVLVMSCNKGMARDNYFEPIKTMWESHTKLQRLFGITQYTAKHEALLRKQANGKHVSEEELEAETREICLLMRGSKSSVDRMRLRWNIQQKDYSGMTAVSLACSGANSSTQGGRWDVIVVDDASDKKNSATPAQRKKLRGRIAELRKQGSNAFIYYLNTPQTAGDVSDVIDREQGHLYHIMYRPALWYDPVTKEPHYYWQQAADGTRVWPPDKIEEQRPEPDFWSQIMLRLRDESTALFNDADFQEIDPDNAPIEVRAGLGGQPISDRDRAVIDRERLRIFGITFIDGAGDEERSNGDDTALVSYRFDRYGSLYITHIHGGRFNPEDEGEAIYDAFTYNGSELVVFEITGDKRKYVRATHLDFQRRKAQEIGAPVLIPIVYDNTSKSQISKGECIDRMYTYTSTGRLYILKNAGSREKIELLKEQFVQRGNTAHDDYADAASRVVPFVARAPKQDRPPSTDQRAPLNAAAPESATSSGGARIPVKRLLEELDGADRPRNWGAGGGRRVA